MENKKKAFTLAEVLIVLTIMGVIAVIMVRGVKNANFEEKEGIAKAYKAIDTIEFASSQIISNDKTNCPVGVFIVTNKVALTGDNQYQYERGFSDSITTSQNVLDMYAQFIKFEKKSTNNNFNFCTFSGYCDASTTSYPAMRIAGDIYIGFDLYPNNNKIKDCPNYYMPENESQITVNNDITTGKKPQCWANVLIDTNGDNTPNQQGKDIFVLGLTTTGIYR